MSFIKEIIIMKKETNNSGYRVVKKENLYKFEMKLKNPHVEKYFKNMSYDDIVYYNNWQNCGIVEYLNSKMKINKIDKELNLQSILINNYILEIYFKNNSRCSIENICELIRDFYNDRQLHITRMFGSYILLKQEGTNLKAVRSTPIPIKYCPLMIKLLKEVSGVSSENIIRSINSQDIKLQEKSMCDLINETVISTGYFDTNRPLNSCEANVLFGASETMASAFESGIIDAAVIVSNNLGTIITTNPFNTQGAVKRMTGLFYTTTNKNIVDTAISEKIIPVFPYTGKIDQLEGVKQAIKLGYKKIAVSVAASDNYLLKEIKELEDSDIIIYKFGLCSTGIDLNTVTIMKDNADIVWSCASKYVKEVIEPNALAQVGIKIPVHIMTERGYKIVKNHLEKLNNNNEEFNVCLTKGEEKPIFYNSDSKIKVLQKKSLRKCSDCPYPCV